MKGTRISGKPPTDSDPAGAGRPRRVLARFGDWLLRQDPLSLSVLLLVTAVSRCLAYPASIWDLDEANFALAVLRFDPVHNQPHPPFFPLWVALGKGAHTLLPTLDVADALRVVSAVLSVAVVVPLRALLARLVPARLATLATALYVFLPGPWLLAGRAYSEPAATTLWIAAALCWLEPGAGPRRAATGALALAGALLIRPQWGLVSLPLVAWALVRATGWPARAVMAGIPTAASAAAAVFVFAPGLRPVLAAVGQHTRYIADAAKGLTWSVAELGLLQAAGGWLTGGVWVVLSLAGVVVLVLDRKRPPLAIPYVVLLLAPHVAQLFVGQNPTLPRYALPALALSAGPLVVAASRLCRSERLTLVAGSVLVAVEVVATWPAVRVYRAQCSPIVAAFDIVTSRPNAEVVACDHRLVAQVALAQASGLLHERIVWDVQVERGVGSGRGGPSLIAVVEGTGPPTWLAQPGKVTTFSCEQPLLRRVAAPRQLDVTVVEGGILRARP